VYTFVYPTFKMRWFLHCLVASYMKKEKETAGAFAICPISDSRMYSQMLR